MKQCRYCKKYYLESDFGVAKTTEKKVYRRWKCRFCYRETKRKLRKKHKGWLDAYKERNKCVKCSIDDYRVLDFHHLRDKEFVIADFYHHQFGLKRLIKEVEKCIVICANCHRLEHFEERERQKISGV